jgi:hypothetical protein
VCRVCRFAGRHRCARTFDNWGEALTAPKWSMRIVGGWPLRITGEGRFGIRKCVCEVMLV